MRTSYSGIKLSVHCLTLCALILLLCCGTAYPAEPTITEAEGHSCMGYDKSRRQTEQEALANAKRNAAEKVKTYIESETSIRNFALENDTVQSYANATIKILVTLESTWYRDESAGDCYRVRIRAEVVPDTSVERSPEDIRDGYRRQLEQKGVSYSGDNFINAARDGRTDIVELFIKAGIDPNSRHTEDPSGTTALIWAVHKGNKELVKLLTGSGADPDISDNYRNKPLPDASERGYTDIARILMESGADIHTSRGAPLILAARKGHIDIVRMLLENGSDAKGTGGVKALADASEAGHTDIARMLIDNGADVNAPRDSSAPTPLHLAARTGRIETVKLLIDRGADINAKDKFGYTPLMRAAQHDQHEIAELLIKKGAVLDIQSNRGETALIWAIRERNLSIAELLIQSGADTDISDNKGNAALTYAKEKNLDTIVKIIEKGNN